MPSEIEINGKKFKFFSFESLDKEKVSKLPYTKKIVLENLLRHLGNGIVTQDDIDNFLSGKKVEIPYYPSRVILQDYTGVPVILDIVAMRNAYSRRGKNPEDINPVIPVDLVADHSLQVDKFGTSLAILENRKLEYERNKERYALLKWAQENFRNMRVVPPGNGIVHQVNIEFLADVVSNRDGVVFPDTVIGTDSHTTMVNGISVLGWGVGGLEAEAVIVGEPSYILVPEVVGVKLLNAPREGVTATDIVLSITEFLRKNNVVGKFVEFYGPGLSYLTTQDKSTIANMAPEYGATVGFFPLTEDTLDYLYKTGRDEEHIELIREYGKKIGLFYDGSDKEYDRYLEFDLSSVEPSIAGPANPEDRIPLNENKILNNLINETIIKERGNNERKSKILRINGNLDELKDGSVVIAAITSCTNTSNPDVLVGAALLAKNAVERGLRTKYYVKTSFAPGSPVVSEYLRRSGLMPYLEALGFHIVGFGCTTCIGNAGPLIPEVEQAIKSEKIYTAAVLSGNRNFEGRINPYVKGAFLASPLLVVAYAISGRIDIDFYNEPLGYDPNGNPVYLRDIWPEKKEIRKYEDMFISRDLYIERKKRIFEGVKEWKDLEIPKGNVYEFDERSTYILEPPWFENIKKIGNVKDARILAIFGDRITTDHISPAGNIVTDLEKYRKIWDEFKKIGPKALETVEIPAAKYLMERGVPPDEFNTYGARRGNHEVMVRGGFANVKIRNLIVDKQGGYTIHYPDGKLMTIFDASMEYQKEGRELVVVAGKMYGAGSSRDWAAKAPYLLGVRAIIAESFERIHRSNLAAMGILPIEAKTSDIKLKGNEIVSIEIEKLVPGAKVTIKFKGENDTVLEGKLRLDTEAEIQYGENGNILNYTLGKLLK